LAETSYDSGDYDASAMYAAESLQYAQLSDEYVALQLKIKEADDAIARARDGMAWAVSRGLDKVYPNEYAQGQALYKEATDARAAEDWDGAIDAARRILVMLDGAQDSLPLPAQYTVRTWQGEGDCLWNIAGYSWVYGDSRKWKLLYEANKSKMPEADNPNLIEPGMVLDIPSANDEIRSGMWQSGRSYPEL
jgi:nucleoid-associated protein YgaU